MAERSENTQAACSMDILKSACHFTSVKPVLSLPPSRYYELRWYNALEIPRFLQLKPSECSARLKMQGFSCSSSNQDVDMCCAAVDTTLTVRGFPCQLLISCGEMLHVGNGCLSRTSGGATPLSDHHACTYQLLKITVFQVDLCITLQMSHLMPHSNHMTSTK